MRTATTTAIGLLLVLACTEEQAPPPVAPPAKRTMPVEPGAPLDLDKPDLARVQVDLAAVRVAIKRAQQIDGALPKTLDGLNVKVSYPADLQYDASTGTVKSLTYPRL